MRKTHLWLTSSGIVASSIITATGGFLLASKANVDWWLLTATLLGMTLVVAAGCILNNRTDRRAGDMIIHTKNQTSQQDKTRTLHALSYVTLLGSLGLLLLATFTNTLTVTVSVAGLLSYAVIYGFWQRRSTLGTIIGSISAATPILIGYTAVTGTIDAGAFLAFLVVAFWQISHLYTIAMYRPNDHSTTGLPALPIQKDVEHTKLYILLCIAAFIAAAALLTTYSYTGVTYLLVVSTFGFMWLWEGVKGLRAKDSTLWAHDMFRFSLRVIMIFSIMISVDTLLP